MSSLSSSIHGIPQVLPGSNGGEVTNNEAINVIDGLIFLAVEQFDLNTPPGSPTNGQCWKIGNSPSGAWASNADEIALYYGGWLFIAVTEGMTLYDKANDLFMIAEDTSDTWRTYGYQCADIGAVTDSTGGSADGTLAAISGSGDDTNINNNFADLAAKINAIRTNMQASNLMA